MQLSASTVLALKALDDLQSNDRSFLLEFHVPISTTLASFQNASQLSAQISKDVDWTTQYIANFQDANTNIYQLGVGQVSYVHG
jgi:hypothetical protein